MYLHTRGKWLIHATNHSNDNKFWGLKHSCRLCLDGYINLMWKEFIVTSLIHYSRRSENINIPGRCINVGTLSMVITYLGWLTHWGRVTHICISKLTIIGSENGLSPGRRQAIIWTNAVILLIRPLGTNFNEMLIEILAFSFMKMRFKVSSVKLRPFCLGLNVLMAVFINKYNTQHKCRKSISGQLIPMSVIGSVHR